jgi:hypothetical protein
VVGWRRVISWWWLFSCSDKFHRTKFQHPYASSAANMATDRSQVGQIRRWVWWMIIVSGVHSKVPKREVNHHAHWHNPLISWSIPIFCLPLVSNDIRVAQNRWDPHLADDSTTCIDWPYKKKKKKLVRNWYEAVWVCVSTMHWLNTK